jgi:hypothetical protein
MHQVELALAPRNLGDHRVRVILVAVAAAFPEQVAEIGLDDRRQLRAGVAIGGGKERDGVASLDEFIGE